LHSRTPGIAAALLGNFDFIYARPGAWLSTPFTFLGIGAEGIASTTFWDRMGPAKAKEALIFGKRLSAQELLERGFINKIFECDSSQEFNKTVRAHVLSELENLDPASLLANKALLQAAARDRSDPDAVNMRESYSQAQRFASGVPAQRFGKIARKELRHKL